MAKNTKYVSEATQFIRGFLKQHPEVVEKQKQLRSTWWDINDLDEAEQKTYQQSKIPVHGYSYY